MKSFLLQLQRKTEHIFKQFVLWIDCEYKKGYKKDIENDQFFAHFD